jgi:hypothetical protein
MAKPRKADTRKIRNKMHIYCEGAKTEPNYINAYINSLENRALRSVIVVEPTKKNTPIQLVDVAVQHKRSRSTPAGDVFWVVYDRESTIKYPDLMHDKAYNKARDNNINIALSNVCFEQWILMHFLPNAQPYSCFDDLWQNSKLREKILSRTGSNYDKSGTTLFPYLADDIATARTIAAAINKNTLASAAPGRNKPHHLNPYTDIPKLLDAIDEFE